MIEVKNLYKKYRIFSSIKDRILAVLSFGFFKGKNEFLILKDLNFRVENSEVLGIIGKNGAGKSTLLKTIMGVSQFESGEIISNGKIRSILELGVGFNPELSGKENLYYNGLVLGYTPNEMSELENRIFSFAGLTEFKNNSLKTYSTGMVMRLAFSLAVAKRPEILLVDEALSVGDASFQSKCIEKFKEFKKLGTSILLVSHDLNLLQMISDKILVLHMGKNFYLGNPKIAIRKYIQLLGEHETENLELKNPIIQNLKVQLKTKNISKKIFSTTEIVNLKIEFELNKNLEELTIGFHIDDEKGLRVFGTNTFHHNKFLKNLKAKKNYKLEFSFPINLNSGKYSLGLAFHKGENHTIKSYLWRDGILDFEVEKSGLPKFDGKVYLPTKIKVGNQNESHH